VVLSGKGHDGATGATAIHRFGGTVLAADAASSDAFAMPSATIGRDQVTDHIVALDDLPAVLITLVTTPSASSPRRRSDAEPAKAKRQSSGANAARRSGR
jgi:two-component system chemotaxis response regulator CheB